MTHLQSECHQQTTWPKKTRSPFWPPLCKQLFILTENSSFHPGGHNVYTKWANLGISYLSVGNPFIRLFWLPGADTGTVTWTMKEKSYYSGKLEQPNVTNSKVFPGCLHTHIPITHTDDYTSYPACLAAGTAVNWSVDYCVSLFGIKKEYTGTVDKSCNLKIKPTQKNKGRSPCNGHLTLASKESQSPSIHIDFYVKCENSARLTACLHTEGVFTPILWCESVEDFANL